jgi:pimeloyl-ACP methyl ester carboxylesterase
MPGTLSYRSLGPADGDKTLFFVHGFPDDSSVFNLLAMHYASQGYRCILVDLPYYSQESSTNHPYFGYTISGIVDLLHSVIEAVQNGGPLLIVSHDFGTIYSTWLLNKHPNDACAIVQFDVGGGLDVGTDNRVSFQTLKNIAFYGVQYQYALIMLWALNRTPGVSRLLDIALSWYPLKATQGGIKAHVIRPASAYSYAYLHILPFTQYLSNVTGIKRLSLYPTWADKETVDVPILFMYGTQKSLVFHGDDWASSLNKRLDGSKTVALPTGHWVFLEGSPRVQVEMDAFFELVFGQSVTRPVGMIG